MKYLLALLVSVLFFTLVKSDYWSGLIGPSCFAYPRLRRNFCNLSYQEQSLWVAALKYLKNTKIPGNTENYYNAFVETHAVISNSNGAHGTSWFPLWHRAFLFSFENACRYALYMNRTSLGITIEQACSFSLSYWAFENDYDNNTADLYIPQENSCIWNHTDLLGPKPNHNNPGQVLSGAFAGSSWPITFAANNDPNNFYNPKYGALTYTLKRAFTTTWVNTYGPSQIMQQMHSSNSFTSFGSYLEAGPHSCMHLWFGYGTQSMQSPDEPAFFLFHTNFERLFTLYQDCKDAEFVSPSSITSLQYQALNPNPYNTYTSPKVDVYNNPINVGLTATVPYYWKAYYTTTPTQYTFVPLPWFPVSSFPITQQLLYMGSNGWQNLTCTYESDFLVNTYGSQYCSPNWTYFPPPSSSSSVSKRAVSGSNTNENILYAQITQQMSELKKKGLCDTDALEALAMMECQGSPRPPFETQTEWLAMNGLTIESFTRICDNVTDYTKDQGVVFADTVDSASNYARVNVMAVVGYVIAGVVLFILIVVGIVIIVRKKQKKSAKKGDVDYLHM